MNIENLNSFSSFADDSLVGADRIQRDLYNYLLKSVGSGWVVLSHQISFTTAWVYWSDWTGVNLGCTHYLGTTMEDLDVRVLLSTTNGYVAPSTNVGTADLTKGFQPGDIQHHDGWQLWHSSVNTLYITFGSDGCEMIHATTKGDFAINDYMRYCKFIVVRERV